MNEKHKLGTSDWTVDAMARALGAETSEPVSDRDLPDAREFVNFSEVPELEGIDRVAWCPKLLCFALFAGKRVFLARWSQCRSAAGLETCSKLAAMKARSDKEKAR